MDGHIAGGGSPLATPGSPRAGPAAGELVTETLDYDGGRQVTVYVPPEPPDAGLCATGGAPAVSNRAAATHLMHQHRSW